MECANYMCPKSLVFALLASCPVCGNPIVGEHIHLEEKDNR